MNQIIHDINRRMGSDFVTAIPGSKKYRKSKTAKNHYYYDDIQRDIVIAAYPE